MIAHLNKNYIKTRPLKALTRLISYAFFEGRPATTKGRWINSFVLSLLNGISYSKREFKLVKQPIFILGIGRSGTTVLGLVLSMHQEVGYLNEPKAIWHIINKKEDVIGSYSQGEGFYRLTSEDADYETCRRAKQLFGAYLSSTFSHRLVDKYPELIFRVDFVQKLFPDSKFIFLIRNGWDTCRSIAAWSERHGIQNSGETHDWWGINNRKWELLVEQLVYTDTDMNEFALEVSSFNRHLDRAVVEWVVTMREGLRLLETTSDCVYTVCFEDLTSKPDEVLPKLCEFCDLQLDTTFLEYARNTLHPIPSREQFDIHHSIAPIFHDTMARLGYNT